MIGRTIKGKYRIYDEVGSGGFATVYLGRNLETNEIVAVKVLSEQYTKEPRYVERFQREAKLAARLQHPNTVRILDHGVEAGAHFLVMEFVQGLTLKQIIERQGKVAVQDTLSYLDGICAGLQAAFQVGVVHRDIKPTNLMITPDGTVKIMDFGIARAESMSGLTQSGVFLGTPRYISPEMAQGGSTDIRSDLYSVGLLAYEMLSGKPPFVASNPWAVLRQQIEADPVPMRQSRPDVPAWLEALVFRAMAKDPDQRFQTPAEMQAALREHALTPDWEAAPTPTLSAAVSAKAPTEVMDVRAPGRQERKSKGLILILLAAALLTIVALAAFLIFGRKSGLPLISPARNTDTQVAAVIASPQPTSTPIILIATNTSTVVGVTDAPTESIVPATATLTPTVPVVAPTTGPTPLPTAIPSPALTDTPVPIATPAPTKTDLPEPTDTASPQPTNTLEPTVPPTPAPTHTSQPTEPPTSPPAPQVTGRLAFSAGGSLHIVDAATGQDTVAPIPGMRQPAFRADGQLVLADGEGGDRASLWTIHANSGAMDREQSPFTDDYHPSWSPGGERFAYDSLHHGKGPYQVLYTQAYTSRKPQPDQALEYGDQWIRGTSPVWMANDWIAFTGCDYWPGGSGGSSCGIYRLPSWGGAPALIYAGSLTLRSTDNHSSQLLFMSQETGNWEVYRIPAQGGAPINLSNSPASQDGLGTFSPDGKMVAFVSNRGGGWAVWVVKPDGTGLSKLFNLPAAPTSPWNEENLSWGP